MVVVLEMDVLVDELAVVVEVVPGRVVVVEAGGVVLVEDGRVVVVEAGGVVVVEPGRVVLVNEGRVLLVREEDAIVDPRVVVVCCLVVVVIAWYAAQVFTSKAQIRVNAKKKPRLGLLIRFGFIEGDPLRGGRTSVRLGRSCSP